MRPIRNSMLLLMLVAGPAVAAPFDDLSNYVEYSDRLSSSGQPSAAQLERLRDAGFERIVNIAFSDHDGVPPHEDRLVKALGMEYLQVPVDWEAPRKSDFYLVAGALQRAPAARTLVHCQANYRASAFSFLYRAVYERVPVERARRDMERIWQPNETWQELIDDVLEENGFERGDAP